MNGGHAMQERGLFDDLPAPSADGPLPEGLVYEPDFVSAAEEAELMRLIAGLPLKHATYKGYVARRRVMSYGSSFDYDSNRLMPAVPLIEELHPWRERVARWMDR